MESAHAAALAAFRVAREFKSFAKISAVAGPFPTGTLCLLAPGRGDVTVFGKLYFITQH